MPQKAKVGRIPGVIVFDLGGVLAEWDGIEPLMKLSRGWLTRNMARRF
jgi:hypothetical protein